MDPYVESWGEILGPQALDLALLTGFLALSLVSFFRKSVRLKYVTFVAAVALHGVREEPAGLGRGHVRRRGSQPARFSSTA